MWDKQFELEKDHSCGEKNLHKLMSNIDKYLVGIDTVLLSPACSSFDEFSSYMERGDFFKKSILEKRCDDDEI